MVKIISYVLNIAGCGPLSPLFRSASGQREVCFPLNYNRMRNGCQYDMNRYVVMDVEHLCKDIVRVVRDALQALIHLRSLCRNLRKLLKLPTPCADGPLVL